LCVIERDIKSRENLRENGLELIFIIYDADLQPKVISKNPV